MSKEILYKKMLGCLYGQAIGDALGLGTEFMNKSEVIRNYPNGLKNYEQIIQDSHRSRWAKGAWTDDTDMMLCILEGYHDGEFSQHRIALNFKDWFNNNPMGIGSHTYKVLCMSDYVEQPEMCSKLWWELSRQQSAANGALMRTSVVGLAPNNIEEQTSAICKLTHYDSRCIGSCAIASLIIHNLVWKNRQLSYDEIKDIGQRYDNRIMEWIDIAYLSPDISSLHLDDTHTIGYTLRTLSAALWSYWHSPSFEAGLLSIINEGGDADTNAAISCAILGAKFGYDSIPLYYIENLYNETFYRNKIVDFINQVLNHNL
ncbi:MAG: ADP-ribosylglycohydrolase family protein [Muribaculaceae bacterium]|nr:ADP-ribosylglycohydrolase family protein [Muribaculaceae bacterium]